MQFERLDPSGGLYRVPIEELGNFSYQPPVSADNIREIVAAELQKHATSTVTQGGGTNPTSDSVEPTLLRAGNWDLTVAGSARYKGRQFPLSGAFRKILARLILARGQPLHYDHLKSACDNQQMEDKSLQGLVCRLRKHLQKHLRLRTAPIAYRDPKSYELLLR
jgi:DNA-binding response OmpR family regulator